MKALRVALLADVHGNAPALAAVLREVESEDVDLLVHAGDLTWGPLVEQTLAVIHGYAGRTAFVRGNADRAVLELADDTPRDDQTERDDWMTAHHDAEAVGFLRTFSENVVTEVAGLGLPYEGRPGAYWALLGPDVDLRGTAYDLSETIDAYRRTDDPTVERMVEMLEKPPTPAEVIEHAKKLVFSD